MTIQANQTSAEFSVRTTADQIEDEDDFLLSLTFDTMSTDWPKGTDWPGGRLMLGNPSITNINIIDVDAKNIDISVVRQSVFEGSDKIPNEDGTGPDNQDATWEVKLTEAPTGPVIVTIASNRPGVATVSRATLTFDDTDYTQAQTVTVEGDEDVEFDDETVTFTHSAEGGGYDDAKARTVDVKVIDDDTPGLVFSPTAVRMLEGGRAVYCVKLNGPPTSRMRVNVILPNEYSDLVTLSTSGHPFDRNDWNRCFNVRITSLEDDEDTLDNGVVIEHTTDGRGGFEGVTGQFGISIEDDDKPGLNVSTFSETIAEDGEVTWQVQLNTEPTADVTVSLESLDPGAATVSPAQLTFTTRNWNRNQNVTVSGVADGDVGDERVSIKHTAASDDSNYAAKTRSILVIVRDTEKGDVGIKLSTNQLRVDEDGSSIFKVSLAGGAPKGTVTIAVTSTDAAKAAVELPSSAQNLTFDDSNWEMEQEVTVNAADETGADADDTMDETGITIMMTATSSIGEDSPFHNLETSVPVTVVDDDRAGIKVAPNAVTVYEGSNKVPNEDGTAAGADDATWTVSLNNDPDPDNDGSEVVVKVESRTPGAVLLSAPGSGDPAASVLITFTRTNFTDGVVVTATGVEDADFRSNDVIVTHTSEDSGYENVRASVTVTVTDADTATIILGQVQPGDPYMLSIEEGADRYQYKVNLSHRPTGRVDIAIARPDANELEVSTSRLTFHPNEWREYGGFNVYVTPSSNDGNEVNDTYRITHTARGGGYDDAAESVLVVMVEDSGTPGVKVSKSNVTMTEGQTVTWDVTLNSAPTGPVTVNVGAKAGVGDVAEVSVPAAELSFDADNYRTAQTITVMAVEDANLVGTTVEIEHIARGANYENVSRTVPVTVNDNDTASLVLEGLTNGVLTVTETNANVTATFMVKLSAEPASEVTVTAVKSSGGSDDVTVTSGASLNFGTNTGPGGWDTAQSVEIQVAPDMTNDNEDAEIKLTAAGAEFANVEATVPVKVIDDEVPGIRVSETELDIDEGSSETFTVALNTQPTADVTVTVSDPDKVSVSLPGNATSLTFTSITWENGQTVTVEGDEDDTNVGDESVEIRVSSSSTDAGYNNLSRTVKATVDDNDTGRLVFDPVVDPGVTVTENSSATYTVKLSLQPGGDVTVTVTSADNNVAKVNNRDEALSLKFTTGNWNSVQTVSVHGTDDMDATNGSTNFGHTATGGGYDITDTAVTQMGVMGTDDDQPEILLSTDKLTVNEGGTASYNVRLKTMPSADVRVTVRSSDTNRNSLTFGDDSNEITLDFTTTNYGTGQTVTVKGVEEDPENAADETVTLTHSASGGGYNNVTQKTVAVTVDDNDTLSYSFGSDSYTGTEGTTANVALNLNIAAPAEKVFTIQVLHNGGASTDDYSMDIGGQDITLDGSGRFTVTFAAGDSTKTIDVVVVAEDPQVVEAGESITFIVTGPPPGVASGSPNSTTISFTKPQ